MTVIEIRDKKIKLLKLGWVKLSYLPKEFTGKIKSVTVSRTKTNEYYVSILTEQELVLKERQTDEIIVLDLGLTDFCITSKGEFFEPNSSKAQEIRKESQIWAEEIIKTSFGKCEERESETQT